MSEIDFLRRRDGTDRRENEGDEWAKAGGDSIHGQTELSGRAGSLLRYHRRTLPCCDVHVCFLDQPCVIVFFGVC